MADNNDFDVEEAPAIETFTEEEQAIRTEIERGLRLAALVNSPGWQDALDIMEAKVQEAENLLIDYDGVEVENIVALQRNAHAMRTFFTWIQTRINDLIQASEEYKNLPSRSAFDANYRSGSTF